MKDAPGMPRSVPLVDSAVVAVVAALMCAEFFAFFTVNHPTHQGWAALRGCMMSAIPICIMLFVCSATLSRFVYHHSRIIFMVCVVIIKWIGYILWKTGTFYLEEETQTFWPYILVNMIKYSVNTILEALCNVLMQMSPLYLAAGLLQITLAYKEDLVVSSLLLCTFPVLQIIESAVVFIFTQPAMSGLDLLSSYELIIITIFSVPSKMMRLIVVNEKSSGI
ncbi:hypothetical protein BC829DRAFT_251857 [Chytridium lagenaria]|nr:hypothetical protein BC829DRAFT_251857 [Chytridium lagenaria]